MTNDTNDNHVNVCWDGKDAVIRATINKALKAGMVVTIYYDDGRHEVVWAQEAE